MASNIVLINIVYENKEVFFELNSNDTIEVLKCEIFRKINLLPSKQLIEGWESEPTDPSCLIKDCVNCTDMVYLFLTSTDSARSTTNQPNNAEENKQMETDNLVSNGEVHLIDSAHESTACSIFISKLLNNYPSANVNFRNCCLKDFVSQALNSPLDQRKPLILYFHNENHRFTKFFSPLLQKKDISNILSNYYILGWDIEDENLHGGLLAALEEIVELSVVSNMIENKISAALILVPIQKNITIFSCLREKSSERNLLNTFKDALKSFQNEIEMEKELHKLDNKTSENDIGSVEYHLMMAEMLGDRDYDSFEHNQHEYLKSKIGYAFFGPPSTEEEENIVYDKDKKKKIEDFYKKIVETNNKVAQWKDRVVIAFMYNCTEVLPGEKLKRQKKYPDYNPKTDLNPVPIFVLRKCEGSSHPCRIFIDNNGRVYDNWTNYLTKNKLHKCEMIVPKDGRYEVTEDGQVLLERHLSPACGVDVKILQVADYVSLAGGLASGGIFVAAAIPALTVAPAALAVGGVVGLTVGAYSIGRSIYTVFDRTIHKESMSFANSEARGAYLNIVAGSLGFVGAGATMAVSQLTSKGVNIGLGARAAVNTLSAANVAAGGVSLANSTYDVFDQWFNDNQTPSLLTMVQLSSSVLFFGNAVYNFRTAGTIIEEVQTRTLQDYHESLRSNRHRKTFDRILKSTIDNNNGDITAGRADVISAITNIQNKDDVFAVLTRSNKLFREKGIRVVAKDGQININGVPVEIENFNGFTKKDMSSALNNLKSYKSVSVAADSFNLKKLFANIKLPGLDDLISMTCTVLKGYNADFKAFVIKALVSLLSTLQRSIVEQLIGVFGNLYTNKLVTMAIDFFLNEAKNLQKRHERWKNYHNPDDYHEIFDYLQFDSLNSSRIINIMDCVLRFDFVNNQMTFDGVKRLVDYFYKWFAKELYDYEIDQDRISERTSHSSSRTKVDCKVCGGYYYN
ncbi:unnamed protein product [Brassicogethes aeneus]|uniref:DUF4781 domain-containing protein n=1 Tax=Brassicogethes aeneus TaxID=1431903 RepID=A0A9P0AYD0_BRAAE|nr:unnamed protein product [Brassicogethes aeneus]